ncbi:MAG TPA: YbhB/YbcL family Raf kinase inhibitor-like protein [Steroidobacteraceae bacterium]
MRRTAWIAGAGLAVTAAAAAALMAGEPQSGKARGGGAAGKFTLASADISEGGNIADAQVFNGFGCKGGNISPALSWSNPPAGTRSFALLMDDPDAPTGSGWWHWVVYNIPTGLSSLPAGAGDPQKNLLPAGAVQGRTDFGNPGYGGPCPPPGKQHHYYLRLYALKVAKLEVPADATAAYVGFTVHMHSLAKTELMGVYGR